MAYYSQACQEKHKNNAKNLRKSRPIIVDTDTFIEILAKISNTSAELCKEILKELIFDVNVKRPDFQMQPIIEINNKILMFSPLVILTTNWEVCLLRKWAKYNIGKYGEIIASKKDNITDDLSMVVEDGIIKTAKRKKLIINDSEVGEVDFSIFDKNNKCVIFCEIKWVIEPDSYQEESHAEVELKKGIEQLTKYIKYAKENLSWLIDSVFGNGLVKESEIVDIKYVLISKGTIDSGINSDKLGIMILDYDIFIDIFRQNKLLRFKDKFDKVLALHEKMENDAKKSEGYNNQKLAGYVLRTPGIKMPINESKNKNLEQLAPNNPCSCGSGKTFQNCCKKVQSYQEDSVVRFSL